MKGAALRISVVIAISFLSCYFSRPAGAQTVGASLQGIVTDSTGAAVPNADVVVVSVATGGVWELKTDSTRTLPRAGAAAGRVRSARLADRLSAGRPARHSAHGRAERRHRREAGGRPHRGGNDRHRRRRRSSTRRRARVSGLVSDKEIRELPLNGRSFQQLALLQTGVTPALAAGNDVVGGRTPKISINGARPEQNSFLLDGTDINNVYNKTPGSSAGVLLGVEAVLEFQVLTNAYSAEFGRSAGGVINAVTRSGANAIHGSGFEFYRNSALDAKNYFDPADKPIPDFFRHQFGGVARRADREGQDVLLRRLRVADRAPWRDRRHRRARRRGAARHPAGPDGHAASRRFPRTSTRCSRTRTAGRSAAARPNTCSRRRSRPTSTSGRSASTIASRAATACSAATRSTTARWIACRRTSRRCRSRRSTRATST